LLIPKRIRATLDSMGWVAALIYLFGAAGSAYFVMARSKARVSPSLVEAFSRALKQFKQTEAFQVIYRKYFP
jgi:ABC-type amino acid transport substrate-binding protein